MNRHQGVGLEAMTFLTDYVSDLVNLDKIVIPNRSLTYFRNIEFKGILVAKDKQTKVYLAECGGLYIEARKGSRIIPGYIGCISEFDYYVNGGVLSRELYQELSNIFDLEAFD